MAEETESQKSIAGLLGEGQHLDTFTRAVRNILDTEVAEQTYAQIVDGVPLRDVVLDDSAPEYPHEHPVYKHTDLCDGVLEKTRALRNNLDSSDLRFKPELLHAYHTASPGSRQFNVRLVELAAVAIHEIAVQLHQLDASFHKDDGIVDWAPEEGKDTDDDDYQVWPADSWPRPTLFWHPWYENHEEYPNGVSDMVGYWAEARILGGVILFDRREPGSAQDVQADSIWLHPNREAITNRIVRLNDDQRMAFINFLTSEAPDSEVLPILPDTNNRVREDSEEPVKLTGIYRDPWERKPWHEDDGDSRSRCVRSPFDYPDEDDWHRARERAMLRRGGFPPYGNNV